MDFQPHEDALLGFIIDFMLRHNYVETAMTLGAELGLPRLTLIDNPDSTSDHGFLVDWWDAFSAVYSYVRRNRILGNVPAVADHHGSADVLQNTPLDYLINDGLMPRNPRMSMDPSISVITIHHPTREINNAPGHPAMDANIGSDLMEQVLRPPSPLPPLPSPPPPSPNPLQPLLDSMDGKESGSSSNCSFEVDQPPSQRQE